MPKKGQFKKSAKADSKRQRRYNSSARQKKRRALRNKIRQKLLASGRVHKGDGMDIDHLMRRTLAAGAIRVVSKAVNRAKNSPLWKRRRHSRRAGR